MRPVYVATEINHRVRRCADAVLSLRETQELQVSAPARIHQDRSENNVLGPRRSQRRACDSINQTTRTLRNLMMMVIALK